MLEQNWRLKSFVIVLFEELVIIDSASDSKEFQVVSIFRFDLMLFHAEAMLRTDV